MKQTTNKTNTSGRAAQVSAITIFNQMKRVRATATKILIDGKVVRFDNPPGQIPRRAVKIKARGGQWKLVNNAQKRLAEAADMLLTRMQERVAFDQRVSELELNH